MKYSALLIISLIFFTALLFTSCKSPSPPQTVIPEQSQGGDAGSTQSPSDSTATDVTASTTDSETEAPVTGHVHNYDQRIEAEEYLIFTRDSSFCSAYTYSCECGARGDPKTIFGTKAHFGGVATCTRRAVCTECGKEYGEKEEHVFDREVAEEKYLAKDVKCSHEATFKKSCACGAASEEETFLAAYDSHVYADEKCTVCGESYYTEGLEYNYESAPKCYAVIGPGKARDSRIIRIPPTYNGIPVAVIRASGLVGCERLEELVIPESVIYMFDGALDKADSIRRVSLPLSLQTTEFSDKETIELVTVTGDGELTPGMLNFKSPVLKAFIFTGKITSIASFAFSSATPEYLVLPEGLTKIDSYAFSECKRLSRLSLPGTLRVITSPIFVNCGLTDISIPEGLSDLTGLLESCSELEHCTIPLLVPDKSIPNRFDSYIRKIFGKGISYETKHQFGIETITVLDEMPDSITLYGNECLTTKMFLGCDELRKLTIDPTSELTMNAGALLNCKNLESLTLNYGIIPKNKQGNVHFCTVFGYMNETYISHPIPDTLREVQIIDADTIPAHFFDGCDRIERIVITGNVKEIGAYAFYGCVSLKEIILPDSVEVIGEGAFMGCSSLERIVLPSSLKEIGELAFTRSGLTYLTFPDSVTSIGMRAFELCDKLCAIELPQTSCRIEAYAFFECNKMKKIFYGPSASVSFIPLGTDTESAVTGELLSMPKALASELKGRLSHGCLVITVSVTTDG